MRVRNLIISVFGALALVAVPAIPVAAAATNTSGNNSGNGLRISPIRTDIVIEPGTTKTVTVTVQDVSPNSMTVQAVINDFVASNDESGSPRLLLNNQTAPSHSLKKLTGTLPNFSLQPNEQKDVTVTITVPKGYPGGGYYGAVRFVPAGTNPENTVSLSASVASLILVTIPGNYHEALSIASFDIEQSGHIHSVFSKPNGLVAAVRFQNSGDVQEQPFGKVLVKKGDKVISSAELNNSDPRANVLPDSIRKFTVPLKGIGSFGKYTVEANLGYASGQLLTAKTTFYVIPSALILGVIIAILAIILLVVVIPRIVRRHDQSVLRRASRR
ncbi:MAG TPA: DUF916 domain-containing protein [Candidatus Saccharimonadales bacterium]|nr:DUF916 domain-containing protein [Candidatus Saccharimonadales bacterium]